MRTLPGANRCRSGLAANRTFARWLNVEATALRMLRRYRSGWYAVAASVILAMGPVMMPVQMKLTAYDDGLACPAGCDSHVVFHHSINGSANAHGLDSGEGRFTKCIVGAMCRVCFSAEPADCTSARYRGGGPPKGTFDFTAAFYDLNCGLPNLPRSLDRKCHSLHSQAESLAHRVNCIREADKSPCKILLDDARVRRTGDRGKYELCRQIGEQAFNKNRPAEEQRTLSCAYEKVGTGGPNASGSRWRRLLPGVCGDRAFVGREGLDCCTGIPFHDASFGGECAMFYQRSPQ